MVNETEETTQEFARAVGPGIARARNDSPRRNAEISLH